MFINLLKSNSFKIYKKKEYGKIPIVTYEIDQK